jgi:hypothetical protein
MWKVFNDGKFKNFIVDETECVVTEYDYLTEQKVEYERSNMHLLEISVYNPIYHTEERKSKYVVGHPYWSKGNQYGYMIGINDGKIAEIYLDIEGFGWSETEDLMQNADQNKEEIEFVQKIINQVSF